ncbi:hypothetical protein HN388_04625, partial [bacterium]|nr:hypothetical protein [bacterium]
MIRKLALILAVFLVCNVFAENRSSLLKDLKNFLAGQQLEQAYSTLSKLQDIDPDNYKLAYNSACLAAKMDKFEVAISDLQNAFELGFDDIRLATSDKDLMSLQGNQHFLKLISSAETTLTRIANDRIMVLESGGTGKSVPLGELGTVTVSADPTGLKAEIVFPINSLRERPEPWFNGGGINMVIAVPDSNDTFDTKRIWRFGFGKHEQEPAGWVISTPNQFVNTRVEELSPRLRIDPSSGNTILDILIPWKYLEPYSPPTDTKFGINVHFNTIAGSGKKYQSSILDDPAGNRRIVSRLRYIPVTVTQGNSFQFSGKTKNSIVGNKPIDIELKLWSDIDTRGTLVADVFGPDNQSVVSSEITAELVDIKHGLNSWIQKVDLSALPQGLYRLTAGISIEDSLIVWSTPV